MPTSSRELRPSDWGVAFPRHTVVDDERFPAPAGWNPAADRVRPAGGARLRDARHSPEVRAPRRVVGGRRLVTYFPSGKTRSPLAMCSSRTNLARPPK